MCLYWNKQELQPKQAFEWFTQQKLLCENKSDAHDAVALVTSTCGFAAHAAILMQQELYIVSILPKNAQVCTI